MNVKNKHGNVYMADKAAPSQWKADYRSKRLRGGILNMKNYMLRKNSM